MFTTEHQQQRKTQARAEVKANITTVDNLVARGQKPYDGTARRCVCRFYEWAVPVITFGTLVGRINSCHVTKVEIVK